MENLQNIDVNKIRHYHLAFSQARIDRNDADYYIRLLSEDTLNYITNNSFDRKLLRPLMRTALKTIEKENEDILEEFDNTVNTIIHDKREMFVLMNTFCI